MEETAPPSVSETVHTAETLETVLVVEDEQSVRDLTVKMLQKLGYRILTAGSGAEAMEISRAHFGPIALLLTDVVMPGMSGRQLADALTPQRPDMKVLFLSGYTEDTIVHHGVLDDTVQFLPKPFSREVLAKKLRAVLGKKGEQAGYGTITAAPSMASFFTACNASLAGPAGTRSPWAECRCGRPAPGSRGRRRGSCWPRCATGARPTAGGRSRTAACGPGGWR